MKGTANAVRAMGKPVVKGKNTFAYLSIKLYLRKTYIYMYIYNSAPFH